MICLLKVLLALQGACMGQLCPLSAGFTDYISSMLFKLSDLATSCLIGWFSENRGLELSHSRSMIFRRGPWTWEVRSVGQPRALGEGCPCFLGASLTLRPAWLFTWPSWYGIKNSSVKPRTAQWWYVLMDKQRISKRVLENLSLVLSPLLHGLACTTFVFFFLLDSFLGLYCEEVISLCIDTGRKEVVRSGHSFLYLTFRSSQKMKKPRTRSLNNASTVIGVLSVDIWKVMLTMPHCPAAAPSTIQSLVDLSVDSKWKTSHIHTLSLHA